MESLAAVALALGIALAALWFAARAATTVCLLQVDKGKVRVVRGGLAPRVLDDVRDIVRRPKVGWAVVRIVRAKDRARVEAKGELSHDQLQQLRNVIGTTPLAKLAGTRKKS
jgi:hypothetical protein